MNTNTNATPRTDAKTRYVNNPNGRDYRVVSADFARQLERENAAMREVMKEASRVLENARFVHQAITTYAPQDIVDKVENQKHCDNMTACLELLKPYLP